MFVLKIIWEFQNQCFTWQTS